MILNVLAITWMPLVALCQERITQANGKVECFGVKEGREGEIAASLMQTAQPMPGAGSASALLLVVRR
jgi:hypothetical protein